MSKTFRGLEELSDLAIVTETDTQTVTNKTIVAASNTITTAASGNLVATELNAALAELDSDITAHLDDTTDAHDASAISVLDTGGYFTGTEVETVLQEVGASLGTVGLQYFTENRNTTAPNATVPVHQFLADGAEPNIDAALTPKGTGAILAQVPDGTATGGNKRGTYAADLQMARTAATQVAAGVYSFVGAGYENTASGQFSVASGGRANVSSGTFCATISGGQDNTASATYSTISGGRNNTASGVASVVSGGETNVASGGGSVIPGGNDATTRGLSYRYSFAGGAFLTIGDAQYGRHIQRISTSDATPSIVTADSNAPSTTNVSVIPDNHAYTAIAYITARDTATGDTASFKIEGAVKRGAGAGTTALVGTPTATTIAADAGAATWSVALVANTTRGSVEVQVTGEAATTIHWVCKLDTIEVG